MSTIEKALQTTQKQQPATAPTDEPPGQTNAALSQDDNADVVIPFEHLYDKGYLTPTTPRGATAEEFRSIKRPLLRNISGQSASRIENSNLIMVTSALEGDGKTYSSLNLAMSIAMEQDKTVLFVDADVHKGSAGRELEIPDGMPGLIDILVGDATPEETILRTSIKNLCVMPSGARHENATELLASKRMHHLMHELSTRYPDRVVIFDSPPLLLTNESSVLASFMGQIVFVAAANITPQHAVREALERIGKDKMVASILNKAPRRRFKLFGIGIGSGYGYGYGYGQRKENSKQASGAHQK
ncbi:MAG: XrtA-associated tyrosine autokinase [Gammaproteobacteria bacterium]|jgi:exopolysaccharide/PEP-CTERM locus tyrosine autokinase